VAVFVDFFHFLLLFLLVVTFVSYFLLLKGVRFVIFCYFFTVCNFQQLLFTRPRGPGFIFYSLWDRGERVHLDFFPSFFLLLRGREGGGS